MNHPLLLYYVISLLLLAATKLESRDNQRKPSEIYILHAESMEAPYTGISSDAVRLIGNVLLKHEGIIMHCDSAHRFSETNIVNTFGNVHINQGDTLQLYGDKLTYYGNIRYAEVRGNVRLMDKETSLTTDSLDFDLQNDFGYYPNGGVVLNGDNRLESIKGYYYTDKKLFFFKDSVVITNPDYDINSDTLRYNTVTEVVYFLGPTTIIGDETNIYCENGWYNTKTDISQFRENARVKNNNQLLKADSIYYDNGRGLGKAFMNVKVTDTIENIIIKGDYAWFIRNPEEMLVTERALLIQMSENDTLYLHADTLRSWLQITGPDKQPELPFNGEQDTLITEFAGNGEQDTLITEVDDTMVNGLSEPPDEPDDSTATVNADRDDKLPDHESISENDTIRIMVAYYGARFFSNDMQGKSDSMYYNMRDSVISMFGEPVIWSEESQLSAEYMEIHSKNGEVDHIIMNKSSFIVSEEEPGFYNQIKGTNIMGYVRDGELYRVHVMGNAETLYYPVEDEEIIGINKAASANLVIFLKDSKPDRIRFLNRPEATLYPIEELSDDERLLKNFQWLDYLRPKYWEDVFSVRP